MHTPFFLSAGLLASAVLFSGCSDDDSVAVAQAAMLDVSSATISYRYRDSSVPPPGHRSYTLKVDSEISELTFDAYGDLLGEQSLTTVPGSLEEVLNRLSNSDLPEKSDPGCVGGPSYTFKVSDASDVVVRRIRIVPCGSEDDEILAELQSIVEPVLAPFDLRRP